MNIVAVLHILILTLHGKPIYKGCKLSYYKILVTKEPQHQHCTTTSTHRSDSDRRTPDQFYYIHIYLAIYYLFMPRFRVTNCRAGNSTSSFQRVRKPQGGDELVREGTAARISKLVLVFSEYFFLRYLLGISCEQLCPCVEQGSPCTVSLDCGDNGSSSVVDSEYLAWIDV